MNDSDIDKPGLKPADAFIKRSFDVLVAALGLSLTWWIILLAWIISTVETRSNGFFMQKRVGQNGKLFLVVKIKTMYERNHPDSTVTTRNDSRITRSGYIFRRTKIDELPQLFNVLLGQMSFVGPRPDVAGFADHLADDDRIILSIRPGITGPATLKYRDEETLLAFQKDPESYNREIIYPDKVRINKDYIKNYSFTKDLGYIWKTIIH